MKQIFRSRAKFYMELEYNKALQRNAAFWKFFEWRENFLFCSVSVLWQSAKTFYIFYPILERKKN